MAGFGSIVGSVLGSVAGGFFGKAGATVGSKIGGALGGAIDGSGNKQQQATGKKKSLIEPLDNGPFRTTYKANESGSTGIRDTDYTRGNRMSGPGAGRAIEHESPILREKYFWINVFEDAYTEAKKTMISSKR